MNYYRSRQRESDHRWDYTCKQNQKVWPIGYCSGQSVEGPNAHKYHSDGHATAEEADECYRRYLLDNEIQFSSGEGSRVLHVCQYPGCEEFTAGIAEVGCGPCAIYHLCNEHRTKEVVAELFKGPGLIIASF